MLIPVTAILALQIAADGLGALYLFLGRPADAEPQFRMATDLRRKVYGARHFARVS